MSDLNLRNYGYSVRADPNARLHALKLAVEDYGKKAVFSRLTKLSKFNPVMKDDIEALGGYIVDVKKVDAVDKVDKVDTVDTVDMVDMVDKIDTVDAVDMVEVGFNDLEVVEVVEVNDLKEACNMLFELGIRIPTTDSLKVVQDAINVVMKKLDEEDNEYTDYADSWNKRKKDLIMEFDEVNTTVNNITKKYKDSFGFVHNDDLTDWNDCLSNSKKNVEKLMNEINELNKVVAKKQLHRVENFEKLRAQRREMKSMCEEILVEFRKFRVLGLQKKFIYG